MNSELYRRLRELLLDAVDTQPVSHDTLIASVLRAGGYQDTEENRDSARTAISSLIVTGLLRRATYYTSAI